MRLAQTHNHSIRGDETISIPVASFNQELRDAVKAFEKRYILYTLDFYNGRKQKTAEALGIDRKTLYLKMKKYKLC